MLDSSPMVCITGQVSSKLLGSDAFQETDITGVTLPITKHNYLVTRVEDDRADAAAGVLRRAQRAAGAGARRHHQGRAAGVVRDRLPDVMLPGAPRRIARAAARRSSRARRR